MNTCTGCGATLATRSAFCPKCGLRGGGRTSSGEPAGRETIVVAPQKPTPKPPEGSGPSGSKRPDRQEAIATRRKQSSPFARVLVLLGLLALAGAGGWYVGTRSNPGAVSPDSTAVAADTLPQADSLAAATTDSTKAPADSAAAEAPRDTTGGRP